MQILSFIFLTLMVFGAECYTMDDPAYARYGDCRTPNPQDDFFVSNVSLKAIPALELDKSKGYLGTIGIVGGGHYVTGKPFIAAMSALRVGADSAHIFCTNVAGPAIQSMSPDIVVHPILDTNIEKMILNLHKMDSILLGPGLDENGHSINVISRVVNLCKSLKKPLILHLDEYFLTQVTINLLLKHPSPGVIMVTNNRQFEKVYALIKRGNSFSDAHAHIKFDDYENFMIVRTGCTDVGMSASPLSSWSNSRMQPVRKTVKQDELISGATATYFFWALKTLPASDSEYHGPMFPAAVATHAASKMVRKVNKLAVEEYGRSATTLDMIKKIHEALYGMP